MRWLPDRNDIDGEVVHACDVPELRPPSRLEASMPRMARLPTLVVQVLEQVVCRELDRLVVELGRSVVAGDQA